MLYFLTAAVLLLAQENEGCPVIRGNPVNQDQFVVHEGKTFTDGVSVEVSPYTSKQFHSTQNE